MSDMKKTDRICSLFHRVVFRDFSKKNLQDGPSSQWVKKNFEGTLLFFFTCILLEFNPHYCKLQAQTCFTWY